jgi:hypothetical protein
MVMRFELLRELVNIEGMPRLPVFRYIQHISSMIGGLAIILVFISRKTSSEISVEKSSRFWAMLAGFTLVIFAIRAYNEFEYFGDIVASIISAGVLSAIITSAIYRVRSNGQKEDLGTTGKKED